MIMMKRMILVFASSSVAFCDLGCVDTKDMLSIRNPRNG